MENFLDLRAYQLTLGMSETWAVTGNGLAASVGSISLERFYIYREFRLQKSITDIFHFGYQERQEEFYGPRPPQAEARLLFGRDLQLGIIGNPRHEKRHGDMGYLVQWGRAYSDQYFRLSRLSEDIYYNEKNVNESNHQVTDSYEQTPVTYKIQGQSRGRSHRVSFQASQSPEARLVSLDGSERQSKQGSEAKLLLHWGSLSTGLWGMKASREDLQKTQTGSQNLIQKQRLEMLELYRSWPLAENWQAQLGALHGGFYNEISDAALLANFDHHLLTDQAYLWLERRSLGGDCLILSLQVGAVDLKKEWQEEGEWFSKPSEGNEGKASVGWIFQQKGDFYFYANSTWDIDLFANKQWDGGNLMMVFPF